jgi:hypothetical protein
LLFERLWEETGCRAVIEALLAGPASRSRSSAPSSPLSCIASWPAGSDRACEKWLEDYAIPGVGDLALHHLYRAMAWLGEQLPASELSVVFLDTTLASASRARAARPSASGAIPRTTGATSTR